jgi:hypothetical protein
MSKPRKKTAVVEESKFQRLIRRGGATSKASNSTAQRATVLLRLDPDLLARLDDLAFTQRTNRHMLIVSIIEKALAA